MSMSKQVEIDSLRQQVASLQHMLEVVNRNRHQSNANRRAEIELLLIALNKSFENVRSLQIDLDAARWSLKQLQSRAQEEPRTPVRLPPTPMAPVKRAREEEEFIVQDEPGTRRARRQVHVAASQAPARPLWREYGRVHLANHDKYRFVTHRKTAATEEAARQAEYAEFY